MFSSLWFSNGLCVVRLAGDLCLVASTPWLLYRIRKDGTAGVSVETQILRLIMFVTRYLDMLVYGKIVSQYNTTMKVALTVTSLHIVTSLLLRYKAYSLIRKYRLGLPLLFAACLAPVFTYQYTFVELAWAFSQFLGVTSNIPQLLLFVHPEHRDWKMNVYVGLLAGYRAFYIPHWVLRYFEFGVWDPVSVLAGVFEVLVFVLALGGALRNNYKLRSQSNNPEDGLSKNYAAIKSTTLAPANTIPDSQPQDLKIPL